MIIGVLTLTLEATYIVAIQQIPESRKVTSPTIHIEIIISCFKTAVAVVVISQKAKLLSRIAQPNINHETE